MAIKLTSKTRTDSPTAEYPYGNIRDTDTGAGIQGTPMNKEVYADFHQFFAKLLADAGVEANDVPENAYDGFQYIEALTNFIKIIAPGFISFTPNATAASGSLDAFGSAVNKCFYQADRKKIQLNYSFDYVTSGSCIGIDLDLPAGFSIDTSKVGTHFPCIFQGDAFNEVGFATIQSATKIRVRKAAGTSIDNPGDNELVHVSITVPLA